MATVIDELTMTLGLDTSGYEDGARRAEAANETLLQNMLATLNKIEQHAADAGTRAGEREKDEANKSVERVTKTAQATRGASRDMEESFGKVAGAIKKVSIELLGMFGIAVSVAAMEKLFMNMSKTNVEAGFLSQRLNVATRSLTEWQGIAGRMGATNEDVASSFGNITQQIQKLQATGQSPMAPVLRELMGIEMTNERGQYKEPEELSLEMADKFSKMTGPRAQFIGGQMGLSPGYINMLQQGREALEKQLALQKQIGTATDEDARISFEFSAQLNLVNKQFEQMERVVTRKVTPGITEATKKMFEWLQANHEWIESDIAAVFNTVGDAVMKIGDDMKKAFDSKTGKEIRADLSAIAGEVNDIVKATGGWVNAIETVFELWLGWKFAKMLANMRLVRLAMSAMGVGTAAAGAGTAAAGAAGAAGAGAAAVGGVVGGIAAAAPELVVAGMLGTLYMEYKNASQADQAKELGFEKAPMAVPGSFFTMPGTRKATKSTGLMRCKRRSTDT